MDYLETLHTPAVTVSINGNFLSIERRPLGAHYQLRAIANQLKEAEKEDQIDLIFKYLELATGRDISDIQLPEITPALNALIALNDNVERLPWQKAQPEKETRTTADYDHRWLAMMVHTLAQAYGWTQEYILGLQPDVAACYLQEIWIDEWEDQRFIYSLSPNIFDKQGNPGKFPPLLWNREWVGPTVEEATGKIPARFVPDGVVKDVSEALTDRGKKIPD